MAVDTHSAGAAGGNPAPEFGACQLEHVAQHPQERVIKAQLEGPAAGFAERARRRGARMVELNPEDNEASSLYPERLRMPASAGLPALFPIAMSG